MVTIAPHRALGRLRAIDGQGNANGEPADSGHEPATVVCFHDGVQVIGLDRERQDSETAIRTPSNGREYRVEDSRVAQRRKSRRTSQRDVNRETADMFGAKSVWDWRPTTRDGWPTRPCASAAPGG